MKAGLSALKLRVIISLFIWSVTGVYCILKNLRFKAVPIFIILSVSSILLIILLYRKYNPVQKASGFDNEFIVCGDRYISGENIIKAFEASPLEKFLFVLKSPGFDYSTAFNKKGLVLKTMYDSYLIDYTEAPFIKFRIVRKTYASNVQIYILYLIWLLPVILIFTDLHFNVDSLTYTSAAVFFVYVMIQRIFPIFYLGKKIEHNALPLSSDEIKEFKNITIIEGFALSDKIAVVPFKKPMYLDGLAMDILFRKYIVINPRVFTLNSKDYLRFVLFHELCHIKHHDSSGVFILAVIILTIDTAVSLLPPGMSLFVKNYIPYYEHFLIGIVFIYASIMLIRRKSIEKRADIYGIDAIGEEGVSRVYKKTGIIITKH